MHDEIVRLETALETLDELRRWTDHFVEMQMMWVDCSTRLDSGAAVRVWNRMDKIMRRVAEQTDTTQQLALLYAELPAMVDKARMLVKQQQHRVVFASDPAATAPGATSMQNQSHPHSAGALLDPVSIRDPVQLPHQWLPRVVVDICESVEREYATGRCRPALVDATRKMLHVVRDRNPYAFFSYLYRPPPPTNRDADGATNGWVLYASPQTDAIAKLLLAGFDEMYNSARWMEKPDTSFWKSFARFMRCVRRVAISFHRVMIHLYATAMQRHDPSVSARDIAREIDAAYASHMSFSLQADGYGLARWFETASDAIFHETYVMFPEVLVYVDQWRHEFTTYEHGFAPSEQARDYEVGFHKWKTSKTWLEIAHQAKRAAQAWHRSRLGTRDFKPMTFQQLGRLEKDIKMRLGKITDLLYKQNLAKWSQQRFQYSRARVLMELQIMAQDGGFQSSDWTKSSVNAKVGSLSSPLDQQKRFRPPTLPRRTSRAIKMPAKGEDAIMGALPIDEDAILKWTDDEIDAHEQETERLYELQGGMLLACDSLSLPQLLSDEPNGFAGEALDDMASVRGLLRGYRRLQALTGPIVGQGEEIALHGAADALIQRPSLRTNSSLISSDEDPKPDEKEHPVDAGVSPSETLESAVRKSALRFLNLHQATAADPDAQESAQKLALEALSLLRRAQDQAA